MFPKVNLDRDSSHAICCYTFIITLPQNFFSTVCEADSGYQEGNKKFKIFANVDCKDVKETCIIFICLVAAGSI
jgi:hypothetical protein